MASTIRKDAVVTTVLLCVVFLKKFCINFHCTCDGFCHVGILSWPYLRASFAPILCGGKQRLRLWFLEICLYRFYLIGALHLSVISEHNWRSYIDGAVCQINP